MLNAVSMVNAPSSPEQGSHTRLFLLINPVTTKRHSRKVQCLTWVEKSADAGIYCITIIAGKHFHSAIRHSISAPSARFTEIFVYQITREEKIIPVRILGVDEFQSPLKIAIPCDPGEKIIIQKISDGKEDPILFDCTVDKNTPESTALRIDCSIGNVIVTKA